MRDHVPVSRDARIRVHVLEPKTLATEGGGGSGVGTARGAEELRARWSVGDVVTDAEAAEAGEGGDRERSQGIVEWEGKLAAGATADLTLAWEVVTSEGVEWAQQFHKMFSLGKRVYHSTNVKYG